MLSKVTSSEISDEARKPAINGLLPVRELRCNWLGHVLRMDERRTARQVLLNCVKPTPESIFGDLIDSNTAISLATDRAEWKKNRPSNAGSPIWGIKRRNKVCDNSPKMACEAALKHHILPVKVVDEELQDTPLIPVVDEASAKDAEALFPT